MSEPTKIGLVGIGKIARDQHIPSIERSPSFALAAGVSRSAKVDGVENFTDLEAFLSARPDVLAVSLCTPPSSRFEMAVSAIKAGRDVMLEKPPGATLGEVEALVALAEHHQVSLFATWHSRFAPAVEPARKWLKGKTIRSVEIVWKEDVRRWHPGQDWIWEAGGFGVFDPGINALSILTALVPSVFVTGAILETPENQAMPIAAKLSMRNLDGVAVEADFDWRQEGPQTWDIAIRTDQGELRLSRGGASMSVDGRMRKEEPEAEYDGLYARFAELVASKQVDVDLSPLKIVADAFLCGRKVDVEPFHE